MKINEILVEAPRVDPATLKAKQARSAAFNQSKLATQQPVQPTQQKYVQQTTPQSEEPAKLNPQAATPKMGGSALGSFFRGAGLTAAADAAEQNKLANATMGKQDGLDEPANPSQNAQQPTAVPQPTTPAAQPNTTGAKIYTNPTWFKTEWDKYVARKSATAPYHLISDPALLQVLKNMWMRTGGTNLKESTRLTEAMLTEVDWNSVKKAVAVGALSMAALGLPNLSHADAQKMTSAELKSWVQQNVQNKPAPQVQQIVNKINAVQPVAPAQKPSVVAPKSVPAPAVQTSIAKAEPVKVEPKLEPVKVEPKLEPESPVHPGEFSIKGLKFGMTLDQVIGVTQATENDYTKPMDTKTYTQPQKPATDWFRAIDDKFSVGGVYGWHAEKENDTLQGLSTFPRSENVDIALNKFIEKYGKPKIRQYRSKTKGGVDLNVFEAEWRVPGAVITMMNHIDRDKGYIKIQSIDSYNKEQQKYKDQSEKASKDF